MPLVILLIVSVLLMYLPQWWVRHQMRKHAAELPDLPGTGGELARHLIERFELNGIVVEQAEPGQNHFSPNDKAVRLSPDIHDGKSITAVAVAAHEVGHAIQFHRDEEIFKLRSRYLPLASTMQRAAGYALMLSPLFALLFRTPVGAMFPILLSLLMHVMGALVYLIVLPEEWDASFEKALPILADGYISEEQLPQARAVLKAAALTYFSAALSSLIALLFRALLLRR
jgi:Zn-dependent membrane protease YugP